MSLASGRADEQRHRLFALIPLALFALAGALVVFDCGNVDEVHARDGVDVSTRVILARVCAVEERLGPSPACVAIGEVLARRSVTGTVTPSIACRYSSHFRDNCAPATGNRPYTHEIEETCEEPPSWPADAGPWAPRFEVRCKRLFVQVDRILAGEERSPCRRRPRHFGAPWGQDLRRALAAGWHRVECPESRTAFWVP